jgi:uncharacterized repeat protein (TIGR01451 family)
MGTASNNAAGGSLVVTVNLDANYNVTNSQCAATGVGPNVLGNAVTCTFPAGSSAAVARTFVQGTVISQPNGALPVVLNSFTSASDSDGVFPPANVGQTLLTPSLLLAKTGPANIGAGESGSYTLTLTNSTLTDATNVVITDTLPAELGPTTATFTGGSLGPGNCTIAAQTVTCNVGSVSSVTPVVVTINFTAAINVPNPTVVNNTATATADNIAGTVNSNGGLVGAAVPFPTNITSVQSLAIQKFASQSSVSEIPEDAFTWTIVVANTGTAPQDNVTVTDIAPAGTEFVTVQEPGTCDVATLAGAGCNLGTIPAGGSATITVEANITTLPNGDSAINTASVTSDQQPIAITATADVTRQDNPDVNIVKTATSATALQGDTITYTILVNNNGGGDADVDVSDVVSGGTVTAVTCDFDATPTNNITDASCDGTVAANSTGTMSVDVLVPTDAALGSTVSDTATLLEGGSLVGTASAVTTVIGPNVTITKTSNGTVTDVASSGLFTVTVTNNGSAVAENVDITDAVPAGLDVDLVTCPIGFTTNGNNCEDGTLLAGESAIMTIEVSLPVPGAIDGTVLMNSATVTFENANAVAGPADSANAAITASTPVMDPEKVASQDPISTQPAEEFSWFIMAKNTGSQPATDVTITDTIPASLTVLTTGPITLPSDGDDFTCTIAGQTVTCVDGDLNPESSVTVAIAVVPNATAVDGTSITNSAAVDCANCPNATVASSNVSVDNDPAWTLTKQADDSSVNSGEDITYTLSATNNSGSAQDATVIDTLPAGVTVVSVCANAVDNADGTVTWTITDLAADTTETCEIVVNVPDGTPTGTSFLNSAVLLDENDQEVASAAALTTVGAQISITKTGPASVVAGEDVTYTISVTNNGTAAQTGIVVQDALPGAPLTFVSASCPPGLTPAAGVLTWTLPSTDPGQTRNCTVVMNVPAGTPIGTTFTNEASLIVNGLQVDTVSVTTTVSNEQITIEKIASKNPVSSNPAETFAYNIIVTNHGNATATGIEVTDTLPAQLNGPAWNAFAIGSFSCTNAADVVTCTGGELGPGDSVVIAVPVTLAA